jgi:hypothetical protein
MAPRAGKATANPNGKSGKSMALLVALMGALSLVRQPPPNLWQLSNLTTEPSGSFVLKEGHEFRPGIAWLMSFPNSGTSYTLASVAKATNHSSATNYRKEVEKDNPESLSIYPGRTEGPYWPGMSGKSGELPDTYVITKTHCGIRCNGCGPTKYIETRDRFLLSCTAESPHSKKGLYPPESVQRAIHLYRNPMHNIISRFHNWRNSVKVQSKLPDTPEGLEKFCAHDRKKFYKQDRKFFGKGKIPKAPCHGEFYKWTLWHNRATEVIDYMRSGGGNGGLRREIPLLKVFYEDYNLRFNETKTAILDFLQLEEVSPFREFASREDYGSYFTKTQLIQIKKLVKSVATETTWADVKHYFQDVPDP